MNNIDLARLELLIRGAEPDGNGEIAFVRCYVGAIMNEPIIDIAKGLRDRIDFDELDRLDWKYLFTGLMLGDKDYRESIAELNNESIH